MVWAICTVLSDLSVYLSSSNSEGGEGEVAGGEHYWMFVATNITAVICFASSASMHHWACTATATPADQQWYMKMDYVGISLAMLG
jgi:hypothetical protein